ncbi:MAG: hypothetical protein RL036_28 [Actinomycetota bacterium]|jgi:hypothetical protein
MRVELASTAIEENYLELARQQSQSGEIIARELVIPGAFIAISSSRDFLFIIRDVVGDPTPSRRLKFINVDYLLTLTAELDSGKITDKFTVVTLPQREIALLRPFCILLSMLLTHQAVTASQMTLRVIVSSLIDLFVPRAGNVRERAKGLFGELSVILNSSETNTMVRAWHDSANANKDFALSNRYIEVKTTEGFKREHEISLSQLLSADPLRPVFIASVMIEEDPVGKSVVDLYSEIQTKLTSVEVQMKCTEQFLSIVGLDYEECRELKFSLPGGTSAIWVFDGREIPRPLLDPSLETESVITGIRFTVNFENLSACGVAHEHLT